MFRRFYYVPTFFNRASEIKGLTTLFKTTASFTVLLGPPSSGKTALVKHVVEQVNDRDKTPLFHPLQIDLRGISADSPDSLYKAFVRSSRSLLTKFTPKEIEMAVLSSNLASWNFYCYRQVRPERSKPGNENEYISKSFGKRYSCMEFPSRWKTCCDCYRWGKCLQANDKSGGI